MWTNCGDRPACGLLSPGALTLGAQQLETAQARAMRAPELLATLLLAAAVSRTTAQFQGVLWHTGPVINNDCFAVSRHSCAQQ